MIKNTLRVTLIVSLVISCGHNRNNKSTSPAKKMEKSDFYFEYFDYFKFKGVNPISPPKEFPFVGLQIKGDSTILNIYLGKEILISKTFERTNDFFVNKETLYSATDSSFKELTVSIYVPDGRIVEYHFVTDASDLSKLVSIRFIESAFEKHFELDENYDVDLKKFELSVEDSIPALEKRFETTFQRYYYKYDTINGHLCKIFVDNGKEKVIETYNLMGLNPFYKDYLYLIKR